MIILDLMKSRIIFGKNKAKYEYQPIIKHEREDISYECENGKLNMYRPPCLKLKIDLNYTTKCPNIILFDRDSITDTRNRIELKQVDDLHN